ncbi:MAG: hypothetical protein DI587_14870 [Variovorax paradoxus]|nr:MAG: hypothetical protein DI583_14870 [Variovorax paradoxus]PZQ09687.1 MAG: hypothetical protein DI587_14870 [Variovorax paradoxus]
MPLRIFIVEDKPAIQRLLAEALEEGIENCTVVGWAASESEAVQSMRAVEWDIALVDLFLEQGSGAGVLNAFKERSPRKHMYVVTNHGSLSIRQECATLGVDAVFDKSNELDALLDRVRDVSRALAGR